MKKITRINNKSREVFIYSPSNNEINKERTAALNDWNKVYSKYRDEYMPKQQRQ